MDIKYFAIFLVACCAQVNYQWILPIMGEEINIQNLKDNPGILPLNLGQARIQSSTHDFIHYFPLEPIAEEIESIEHQYQAVTTAIQDGLSYPYFNSLQNFDQALQYQLKSVKEKFSTIHPNFRKRRGLINGLGSVIKFISGNLDQEDAEKYNKAIASLKKNQENIIDQVNGHISLNTKILGNLNETITLLTHNQETIKKETQKIRTELNKFVFNFNHYLQTRNVLDQLNLVLQIILQLLNDLEEAVILARINTLHNSLIKKEELQWTVKTMKYYHSAEQLLYSVEDAQDYYNVITVDAYYANETIVFILHFPVLDPKPFTYYHLFSIPTYNHTTIVPPAPYLLTNQEWFQYIDLPCKDFGSQFLCLEYMLQSIVESKECINQILQLNTEEASCEYIPVQINNTIIQKISEEYYIAIFPEPTKLTTQCLTVKMMALQGTFLIKLPLNCEMRTTDQKFTNLKTSIPEEPLTLPNIKTIPLQGIVKPKTLKLDRIPLDGLYKLMSEEEHIQPITKEQSELNSSHYWVTPIYIILTLLLLYIGFIAKRRFKRKEKSHRQQGAADDKEVGKVLFVPYKTPPGNRQVTEV